MGTNDPMCTRQSKYLLAALMALPCVAAAAAADDCKAPSSDCVAVGGWNFSVTLGAGIRTNPLVHGRDIPLIVIPQFSYYGKRAFIDNLDLGVTLAESNTNSLNLVASPGYDRVFFYRSDLQNFFVGGLPSASFSTGTAAGTPAKDFSSPGAVQFPSRARHVTYLAGPEWTFKFHGVSGQFDFLHEITGRNHGDEVRAALGIPLVESTGSLSANIGLTWKSAAIVNYYYGASNIYAAGAALNPFLKVGYSLPLRGKWRFTAFAHYERLGNAIANSPIVGKHSVVTVFAGTTYAF
jgi:outer membrane protein